MTALVPESIDISKLPSLLYQQRRNLPISPAVYFILHNGKIIYIGKSERGLRYRFVYHSLKSYLEKLDGEVHIAWIAYRNELEPKALRQMEVDCVYFYNRDLNTKKATISPTGRIHWTIPESSSEKVSEKAKLVWDRRKANEAKMG